MCIANWINCVHDDLNEEADRFNTQKSEYLLPITSFNFSRAWSCLTDFQVRTLFHASIMTLVSYLFVSWALLHAWNVLNIEPYLVPCFTLKKKNIFVWTLSKQGRIIVYHCQSPFQMWLWLMASFHGSSSEGSNSVNGSSIISFIGIDLYSNRLHWLI